jgi:hypothetical protein
MGATMGLSCDCKATMYTPITAKATIADTVMAKSSFINAALIKSPLPDEGFAALFLNPLNHTSYVGAN